MNNKEKNTYVKEQITKAMLKMLDSKTIADISVRDLCREAGVGRASFYRNYETKEDVVSEYAGALIKEWGKEFENDPASSPYNVFGSLFAHYKKHAKFYTMLCRQNMSYLMLDTIKEKVGLVAELSNQEAYGKAFFAYGLYGWVLEWIGRGMRETPDEINRILLRNAVAGKQQE